MRLWHQELLPILPAKQLASQHSECCGLRGKGWGKRHSTIDYIFKYDIGKLYAYHKLVMDERIRRRLYVDAIWLDHTYRGQKLGYDDTVTLQQFDGVIYEEHNYFYLVECLLNLIEKLKDSLQSTISVYGLQHPKTIEVSQELDLLLVKYYTIKK